MSDGKIAGMATALAQLGQTASNLRQLVRKAMKNPCLLEELSRGHCQEWFARARQVIANHVPQARPVGLGLEESDQAGG